VAYLIDGNNLIGYISPSNLKKPESKRDLAYQLLIFQKFKKTKIFLVFDGPLDLELPLEDFQKKSLSIFYPNFGQDADYIIKKIIDQQTDLRRFYVVSSDRDIKNYARRQGAISLSSAEFSKQLKKVLKRHKKSQEMKKDVANLSPLEISYWLKIFSRKK